MREYGASDRVVTFHSDDYVRAARAYETTRKSGWLADAPPRRYALAVALRRPG